MATDDDKQTLDKLGVEVSHLCSSFESFCKEVKEDRTERKEWERKLDGVLYGKGKDKDYPGLFTQLDRLNSWRRRVTGHLRFLWVFLTSAILAIIAAGTSWLIEYVGRGK